MQDYFSLNIDTIFFSYFLLYALMKAMHHCFKWSKAQDKRTLLLTSNISVFGGSDKFNNSKIKYQAVIT